jgi:hypothetical protein
MHGDATTPTATINGSTILAGTDMVSSLLSWMRVAREEHALAR